MVTGDAPQSNAIGSLKLHTKHRRTKKKRKKIKKWEEEEEEKSILKLQG